MAVTPSLNSLPYEIRQTIYSLVGRQTGDSGYWRGNSAPTIAHYATVSREWQEAFEGFTFRELRVTPKRLKSFSHIVTSPRRRAIVQTIHFHVSLDRYEPHLGGEQESSAERRRGTEVLTAALGSFFRVMTNWRKSDTSPLGLDLHLLVDSPSDSSTLTGKNGGPMVTGRALTSYLKLDLETLSLPHIDVFSGLRCTGRHLQPTSILAIVSRLRTLEYLDVELNHDSTRKRDVKQRNNFAMGLDQHGETVRVLSLRRPSPMLTPSPSPPKQPWSDFYVYMRNFSQQCESFEFDDCIDAAQFFAPFLVGPATEKSLQGQDVPFWIRLKRLNVRNSYMMKAPYLRVANRIEALASVHKVLVAIGRAACRMPDLLFARVCQYVLSDGQLEWFVLTYECYAGKAVLRAKGFILGRAMTEAWKHCAASKGLGFVVHNETDDPAAPEL
ncbi:uncharacterized protein F4822DRAFT_405089 [Hypoxylon trugodes]|uniref:uncharacterized protein n=1 Tax=Hypoxylon trugodes TaxID=326681 RepID=UPI00218CDAD2|nr:uncharacterized protein F4822DRAFT_405089 [Hypoxylon trugodes]KAI1389132.1 hypothetical protein F4822DRAFT_405089 [Hypoxylon trugodes]